MEKLNSVQSIKRYFEADGGRPVGMQEFRALTPADRQELAEMCAKALGVELVASAPGAAA